MTVPFGFIPASGSAIKKLSDAAGGNGAQPASNAPVNPVAPPRIAGHIAAPNDTNPTTPLQTLSDTLLSVLATGPNVGSGTDNIGPAVITETAPSGGTVDLKKIAILAGIALGAWFLWKKYGKKVTGE